jgi:hypothetical protein
VEVIQFYNLLVQVHIQHKEKQMAHFAQLDNDNKVLQVIVVNNTELLDENNVEQEQKGIDFCKSLLGADTNWVQTSYNNTFRKNFAGIGSTYNEENDVFYAPQPYPSWTLNNTTWLWEAPTPMPTDGKFYMWDETILNWKEITYGDNNGN